MINPVTNSDNLRRKRKKKTLALSRTSDDLQQTIQNNNKNQWKSPSEQMNYSSKLLQALRHIRTSSTTLVSATSKKNHLVVREAADRALAVTAKGKSRWSRAILKNRIKLKKFLKASKKPKVAAVSTARRTRTTRYSCREVRRMNGATATAVKKKGIVLGRLVPGCKKQPLSVVLEEAHDYISALEMQVRAMSSLVQLLSVAAGAVAPPPPRPSP